MAETGRTLRTLPELAAAFGEWTAARSMPDTIRNATFHTVRRGFDPKEVSAYLERVAADVERIQNRVRQLEAEKASGPQPGAPAPPQTPEADGFPEQAAHITELIRRFDEDVRMMRIEAETEVSAALVGARSEADEIRREARLEREEAVADAASIVAQAQADAQRMQTEAQMRAEELGGAAQRTLRDARAQADEIIRSITSNRQIVIEDVRHMRDELVMMLARLDAVLAEREDADRLIVVDETPRDTHTV
ncbi:MAG: DivIVA domain-containing protein [Actinomycetota bacterium]